MDTQHTPCPACNNSTPFASFCTTCHTRLPFAVLGIDTATGKPVFLPVQERTRGLYVIGKNGTGKSTLLENLIVEDMEQGIGVCVLDPHGDLVDAVLERVPKARAAGIVVLDVADTEHPFGLNLFAVSDPNNTKLVDRAVSQLLEVFDKLWGPLDEKPLMANLLRHCAYTLIANPGFTLAELPLLLTNDAFRQELIQFVTNEETQLFWQYEYPSDRKQQREYRSSTMNKVSAFLSNRIVRNIIGQSTTTVDFRQVMDTGKCVLVRLALGEVGREPVRLIGAVLLGQILNAAYSRQELPRSQRRQFHLYVDEYQYFATGYSVALLTEGRKFGVGTCVAHQMRGQFEDPRDPNRGATLNAASLIVFQVIGEDADELAAQFDHTPPPPAVIGQQEKRTTSQDPITHLVRYGHENKQIRELTRRILTALVEAARQLEPGYVMVHERNGMEYETTRQQLQDSVVAINTFLARCMDRTVRASAYTETTALTQIAVDLRGWISYEGRREIFSSELLRVVIITLSVYPGGPNRDYLLEQFQYVYMAEADLDVLQKQDLPYDEVFSEAERIEGTRIGKRNMQVFVRTEEEQAIFRPMVELFQNYPHFRRWTCNAFLAWCRVWIDWLDQLIQLSAALAKEPILVGSGQYEPILDKPRTYADVQSEITSRLANLPRYTARCKLSQGDALIEVTIKTLPPLVQGDVADAQQIRATQGQYCRDRTTVEQEIRHRQHGPSAILDKPHEDHIPPGEAENTDEEDEDFYFGEPSRRPRIP